ncbi:5-oxoprolinase subunit PxpB [Macrococcus psychrotolerans]|uniref:5-oxoprolinase subunit PxpB n=2 Tax=Macrococcus TaxID=69965 RepID=A0AAU6R8C3_9STAP
MMKFFDVSENCISCVFNEKIAPDINKSVIALSRAIEQAQIEGITELVNSYNTLVIYFNDDITTHDELKKHISELKIADSNTEKKRTFVIPVCYDKKYALDLEELAAAHELTTEEVIQIHSENEYLVYMLGFMPGFPYLGGLDERIATPRRSSPRKAIPAGSVGIAANQTGMYPLQSPGGWNIIGQTPLKLYDPNRNPVVYYEAGDYIKYEPITLEQFDEIKRQVEAGTYEIQVKEEK